MPRSVRIRSNIDSTHRGKTGKRNRPSGCHAELDPTIQGDGPFSSLAPAAKPRAAGGETSHEYGEYGGHGIRRVSKNQSQLLAPRDLINQACGAGKKEAKEQACKDKT